MARISDNNFALWNTEDFLVNLPVDPNYSTIQATELGNPRPTTIGT
jgi:hypothetical protein